MATSSSTSTNSPKISMLKAKTGFIIPKNKLSGSLVPAYKGVKKADGSDVAQEESTKQMQRKTKWGPDFTQDATVRKGRALAYQVTKQVERHYNTSGGRNTSHETYGGSVAIGSSFLTWCYKTRVDQITQLLDSGSLASRNEKSLTLGVYSPELEQQLELEKQEAIGEVLKINPTYKAPSDYKHLTREARVPLPMKEDVGYSFVNLVFGPSDTQKRVERETGAAIRVYGTKSEDGKKIQVEVSASDGNELLTSYKDLHVLVSADSYEKVDAAVALIEFIVSSVSGKSAAEVPSVQGDDTYTFSKSQNSATDPVPSAAMHNQASEQSLMGSVTTPHGNIRPNTVPWLQMGTSPTPGFSYFPNSSAPVVSNPVTISPLPFYPSNMPSFSPRPGHASAFGSPHNSNLMPPRSQPSLQSFPNSFPSFPHPSGQSNTPSNSAGSPFSGYQLGSSVPSSISGFPAGHSPQRQLTPAGNSGWSGVSQMASPVSASTPSASVVCGPPRPLQTQSSASMLVQHFGQVPTSPNNPSLGSPIPRPLPPAVRPSFTPIRSMGGPAPVAQQNNAGDFTYQPHRSDMFPHPTSSTSVSGMQLPPAPPSFRPAMQAPPQRPPMGNQMGHQLPPSHSMNPIQIPPSNMNAHMGLRNHNMFPPNAGPPFLPCPGNAASFQQALPFARPGNPFPPNLGFRNNLHMAPGRPNFGPSSGQQFYDPFSPTSVPTQPQHQGGNVGSVRRQENDPEYEDLMASVGVK